MCPVWWTVRPEICNVDRIEANLAKWSEFILEVKFLKNGAGASYY